MMNNHPDLIYLMTDNNDLYSRLLDKQIAQNIIQLTDNQSEATIVLADPPLIKDSLNEFTQLQWLQSTFAGIDSLIQPELRTDYQLTNIKGPFGQLISEYVLGYTLSYTRHLNNYQNRQAHQQWSPLPYDSLQGKTLTLLGTGTIAREVAEKLSVLGLKVEGVNTSGITPEHSAFAQVYPISELNTALKKSDIIVNTLPHTKATTHILNAKAFSACHNALLFNVGRGSAIEETDLLRAIASDHIAHAFLDVFAQEPLPKEHPFWHHDNITVTPHIAAVSFPEQVAEIFIENLARWQQGKPLQFVVDFAKGY